MDRDDFEDWACNRMPGDVRRRHNVRMSELPICPPDYDEDTSGESEEEEDDAGPDFSVHNYTIEELLKILKIYEAPTRGQIMGTVDALIRKYRQANKPEYVEFFSAASNKLLSNYGLVQEVLGPAGEPEEEERPPMNPGEAAQAAVDAFRPGEATPPGENMFKNEYYDNGGAARRIADQLPNRKDNIGLIDINHATQGQEKLLMPNFYLPGAEGIAQGNMNPMMRNYFITWINVDSHYREIRDAPSSTSCTAGEDPSGIIQLDTPTDFTFTLSDPLDGVIAMTVDCIEIPMASYYTFSDRYGTTTFDISFNGVWRCVRVPEGNYSPDEISEVFTKILNNNHPSVDFNIAVNPCTQKVAITSKHAFTIRWYSQLQCAELCDASSCNIGNTGGKIDSNLGWVLGFRNTSHTSSPDLPLHPCYPGSLLKHRIESECVFNRFGTRYLILEVDDFNRNRNSGNMSTLTAHRDKFKIPDYYRASRVSRPACPGKPRLGPVGAVFGGPIPGPSGPTGALQSCTISPTGINFTDGRYGPVRIPRACRKGTPNPFPIIDGSSNLTYAQKYTAQQILNARRTISQQRYFAPSSSNVLFRFPVERTSENPQRTVTVCNNLGFDIGRIYFGPTRIKRLRIRILDDKGYPLDICEDISFSLLVKRLYQY